MKQVFIVHGFQGSPNGGWRPWLMSELEKDEVYACALPMPNPNDPIPSEWIQEIARVVERSPRDRVYLVGHSLGVPAILRYLEQMNTKKVKGIVLVSGPCASVANKKVDRFVTKPFDWKQIRSTVKQIVVIHGSNDPLVPLDQGRALAKALDAELMIVKNGGHLNGSAGWLKLPHCLKALKRMLR